MDLLIKGRRALVTGASLGIGRAVAEELAREGCDVAMVARTEDTLRQAADEIARASGRRVVAVPADASVAEAIVDAVEQATRELGGPIDILVNNAGSTPEDGIDRVDFAKWQYSVALKQFGYARFAQLVLPAMRAQKWGRIVNVIGRSGHQPRPVVSRRRLGQCGPAELHQGAGRRLRQGQCAGDRRQSRPDRHAALAKPARGGGAHARDDRRSIRWPRDRRRAARPHRHLRGVSPRWCCFSAPRAQAS